MDEKIYFRQLQTLKPRNKTARRQKKCLNFTNDAGAFVATAIVRVLKVAIEQSVLVAVTVDLIHGKIIGHGAIDRSSSHFWGVSVSQHLANDIALKFISAFCWSKSLLLKSIVSSRHLLNFIRPIVLACKNRLLDKEKPIHLPSCTPRHHVKAPRGKCHLSISEEELLYLLLTEWIWTMP